MGELGVSVVSVKILIQNREGKYLLQMRDNRPDALYPLQWGLWGGGVDEIDASPQTAACREVQEELGLTVSEADMEHLKTIPLQNEKEEAIFKYQKPVVWGEFVVNEGAGAAFFTKDEMLRIPLAPSPNRAIEHGLIK
jgi:8-oxo-dGTP pyrophosphatase MutT (NUDIX family)